MARESREVWAKRVERWRDSGLSATEFAAETGIKANNLRHWAWRLTAGQRRAERQPATVEVQAEAPQWVEVAAPTREAVTSNAASEGLELVLASGLVVRVPARFEPEALRRLLAVVG